VANVLARSDLAVAAVTDHNRVEGALRVREALSGRGPEIIIGTEVTTADGHLLAIFIDQDASRISATRSASPRPDAFTGAALPPVRAPEFSAVGRQRSRGPRALSEL
jgi:hypothetical protein